MIDRDTHCIRRLRFRGRLENPRLARHRVEAALADGAGSPRLGKEAILCVRRLAIPLRRVEKLRDALEEETSAAARPAHGPVPANANAVLFADRAELLSCLARDWCAGDAAARWWWPVLFPRGDFGAVVRRAWLKDGQPLPAALTRLESAGLAAEFLTKLSPVDVAALWRNLVHTFHLAALDAAWSAIDTGRASPAAVPQPLRAAPWSPWVESHSSLPPETVRVLTAAILLERAPAVVRSVSFACEVRAWNQPVENRRAPALASDNMFPLVEDASPKGKYPPGASAPVVLRSALSVPLPDAKRMAQVSSPNVESTAGQTASPPSLPQERFADARVPELRPGPTRFEKDTPITSSAGATDESVALWPAALPDRIVTEWGGSLYLVNVAIALGLYGDFTMPARPGLALPLWDFLALLGGRIIGEEFTEDPLPALFARLSGRAEEEPPGAYFEPPTGEPLPIWLDRICHDIRERLAASLGLGDDCNLRTLVLNHHAKIETTSARIDAHFSLAKHPIELRMASLDRDPGWVPAGGRSIHFHYD